MSAAVFFTVGGIYMKLSQGLTNLTPSLLVYLFFCAGASFQTLATNKSELGATYILVLGLESILALLFGVVFFQENYSFVKLLGVSLIVAGIVFLRANNS
jgi:small multidrug resistance pump/quaternary ammonium compound-resistance protein SugE